MGERPMGPSNAIRVFMGVFLLDGSRWTTQTRQALLIQVGAIEVPRPAP